MATTSQDDNAAQAPPEAGPITDPAQSRQLLAKVRARLTKNPKATILVVIAVIAACLATDYTLGGFTATIVNPTNSFASGSLQLEESQGSTTCYSNAANASGAQPVTDTTSFNCTVINNFGASSDVVPGAPTSTTISMTNLGGKDASAETLTADSTCHVTPNADNAGQFGADPAFCSMVDLTIENTTVGAAYRCLYPVLSTSPCDITTSGNAGNLTAIQGDSVSGLTLLPSSGAPATYVFTTMIDPSASASDMGVDATLGFTWTQS
jgi:hypothetical protein